MANEDEKIKQGFRLRGADLGDLLGRLLTAQEGDEVTFQGRVYVNDELDNTSVYEGDLRLKVCTSTVPCYKNYRLSKQNSFTVPVVDVDDFVLSDKNRPQVRPNHGPFLYAKKKDGLGYVIIESLKEPAN